MAAFIVKILLAITLAVSASFFFRKSDDAKEEVDEAFGGYANRRNFFNRFTFLKWPAYALSLILLVWAFVGTSLVWIESGNIGIMKRIYAGKSLPPGRIVALDGELGPQARILTAGFHFEPFINIVYDIDPYPVFTVSPGKCYIMSARDGLPAFSGSAFAAPWEEKIRNKLVNDATFFLTEGKGQRGPQTSCLMPGSYTINPFLWDEPKENLATRVEQGTVGVIKSAVHAAVDFGSFVRKAPTDDTLKVLTEKVIPKDGAKVRLVPVGAIGVWEEALPNGLYYINRDAYKVTMVPTVGRVYEYKGGYTKRIVNVTINDKGQIVDEKEEPVQVKVPEEAADGAITTTPEGWTVFQELRALVQVDPLMAPYVVASLGLTEENATQIIEDRVVTPIFRSVVREVIGGSPIRFQYQDGIYEDQKDDKGNLIGKSLVLDEAGQPKTRMVIEFRPVKVLDLLDRRESIESAIEGQARPEATKEGVLVNEVRLAHSEIPPELLIARKREQLAQQQKKAFMEERLAQVERQATEKARATADQQKELVQAEIAATAAQKRAEGRLAEGQGEKDFMTLTAAGQKAGVDAVGADRVIELQKLDKLGQILNGLADKHPEVLAAFLNNAQKFVPNTQVVVNGDGKGAEGAAGIFGALTQQGLTAKAPLK